MLDWVANEGFGEFFGRFEFMWRSGIEFRQRYLIAALRRMVPAK